MVSALGSAPCLPIRAYCSRRLDGCSSILSPYCSNSVSIRLPHSSCTSRTDAGSCRTQNNSSLARSGSSWSWTRRQYSSFRPSPKIVSHFVKRSSMFSGVTSTAMVRDSFSSWSSPNSTLNSFTLIVALPVTFAANSGFFRSRSDSVFSVSTARVFASAHASGSMPSIVSLRARERSRRELACRLVFSST